MKRNSPTLQKNFQCPPVIDFFQDFNEDESESEEENTSESEIEDENDASNEEDYTSSGEDDEPEADANLSAENLRKLLPCSIEEFEKVTPFMKISTVTRGKHHHVFSR